MGLLTAIGGRRVLSCVVRGYSSVPNACNMSRNNSNHSIIILSNGGKSSEILCSSSLGQINRRHIHNKNVRYFQLIPHDFPTSINIFYFLPLRIAKCLVTFLVDRNFNAYEFLRGAKQALQYITENLVNENVAALKDVITPECLDELLQNIKRPNEEDKKLLLYTDSQMSRIKIRSIKLEDSGNGYGSAQALALEITVTDNSVLPIISNGMELMHLLLKFYSVEFKRTYAQERKSPWIVSKMNICFFCIPKK